MSEKEKDLADIYILDGFSYLVHRNFDLFSRKRKRSSHFIEHSYSVNLALQHQSAPALAPNKNNWNIGCKSAQLLEKYHTTLWKNSQTCYLTSVSLI